MFGGEKIKDNISRPFNFLGWVRQLSTVNLSTKVLKEHVNPKKEHVNHTCSFADTTIQVVHLLKSNNQ